jgi:hypothetical protein
MMRRLLVLAPVCSKEIVMPFLQVTKAMAERRGARRKTRQAFDVAQLTGGYERAQAQARTGFESEQQAILQDYQTQLATYSQGMAQYEQAARDFQARSEQYNQAVNRFNTLTTLPGTFSALPLRDRPGTYLSSDYGRNTVNRDLFTLGSSVGQALANVPGVGRQTWALDGQTRISGFDSAQLPNTFVLNQIGTSSGGVPMFSLAQRAGPDPGQFTEAFTAQAPTAPVMQGSEGVAQKYTAALQKEQEYFEREIGARRASSLRARRRMTDRPLLSGA